MSEEVNLHYLNAKRDVDHSYWNSLLSLNGILISVFTAFSFLSDFKIITSIIVFLSIIACWLIIKNFKLSQNIYDRLGTQIDISSVPDNPTAEQIKAIDKQLDEIKKNYFNPEEAKQLHTQISNNERNVVRLFYIQMTMVVALLFINIIKGYFITC